MKKLIAILILGNSLFFSSSSHGNLNSKIIVKVENEIITNYDLKNKILTTLVLSGQEINQKNVDSLKKSMLNQLINLKLKKLELSKFKIQKDEVRINSYLNSISNNNLQDFKKKFLDNNISFELFLDEIDTDFRWQKLIYALYSKKINIDENIVSKEIKKIVEEKSSVEEFELSEIEVNLDSENSEKRIKEISEKIKTTGFENTALNFSISSTSSQKGYLGWINGEALSEEIYQLLSKINVGEITEPFRKQNNVLFLKILNKRIVKSKELDVEKLKNDIITQKKTNLFNLYSQSRLSKLKNSSYIKY